MECTTRVVKDPAFKGVHSRENPNLCLGSPGPGVSALRQTDLFSALTCTTSLEPSRAILEWKEWDLHNNPQYIHYKYSMYIHRIAIYTYMYIYTPYILSTSGWFLGLNCRSLSNRRPSQEMPAFSVERAVDCFERWRGVTRLVLPVGLYHYRFFYGGTQLYGCRLCPR